MDEREMELAVELAGWLEIPGGLEDEDVRLDDIDREFYLDTIGG